MGTRLLFIALLVSTLSRSRAQEMLLGEASNPVSMRSRGIVDIETYVFHNEAQFYALRLGYNYGLQNERHVFGMSLPLVHTVFKADYAGFENTTGFGDLKMSYLFVPYVRENVAGLARVTVSLDVTAPTGEYRLGRGAGAWLYKPGVIFTFSPGPALSFYPEMRFQFSGSDANIQAGTDGVPDPDDPQKDSQVQNMSLALPMVAELEEWQGWFAVNALYTRSFVENTNFFFVRMDIGKMMGDRASASLRITKFIAGQPRLNVVVQASAVFFMR